MTIAVIGTGRMGSAMAVRLRESGLDVVVHNRSRPAAERTGAPVADTAREAAGQADTVFVSLADDEAVVSSYTGPDGLVAGLRPDTVVLETSTVDPETVRTMLPLVLERGAILLAAPVSGSVPVVQRGELTFMVGGEAAALDRVRPTLDVLAKQVFHVGEVGAGAVVKLSVNTVIHAINQALAEALVLAERAGVPRETTYEVFAASAIASPFVGYKREAFVHPSSAPVAFTLALVAKDLDLIQALAERVDAPMRQTATTSRVVKAAVAAGLADYDMSAIAQFLLRGLITR